MAKKAKAARAAAREKSNADPDRGAAVSVSKTGAQAAAGSEGNQAGVPAKVPADASGAADGSVASGAGVEGAATGQADGAAAAANQAETSAEQGGATAGRAVASNERAADTAAAGEGSTLDRDQASAAAGGVADAAEAPPIEPIGEGAGFVSLDGAGRAHVSEGPKTAAALMAQLSPGSAPVEVEEPLYGTSPLAMARPSLAEVDEPELTPVQMLAMARAAVPYNQAHAALSGMSYALETLIGARGDGNQDDLNTFIWTFAKFDWCDEAHQLIVNHPGLPPDALWLHLTARELLPRGAESFAELPEWQQDGFRLIIAVHQATWGVVSFALDRQEVALRDLAQAKAPRPRVKLSDTIFEKHDRIDALVDGLRLNPRR